MPARMGVASGEFEVEHSATFQAGLAEDNALEDSLGSTAGARGVMVRNVAELLRDAVKANEETA